MARRIEFKAFRRWTLYCFGLAAGSYQVLFNGKEANPATVILIAGALGLDSFLVRDETKHAAEQALIAAEAARLSALTTIETKPLTIEAANKEEP